MQLGKPKAVGIFYDHQRGVRIVHADFNNGGGNEHLRFAANKALHDCIFFRRAHFAVQKADCQIGTCRL